MKKNIITDTYVKVVPDLGWKTLQNIEDHRLVDELKELMNQVKRHVDGFESVDWEIVRQDVCEYCLEEWEVDDDGCPSCCGKAVQEFCEQQDALIAKLEEGNNG